MDSATVSTKIDLETAKKLDELARVTQRTRSFLASEAIEKYVEEQFSQVEAIHAGIEEADAGRFADEKEVKKTFSKWGVDAD